MDRARANLPTTSARRWARATLGRSASRVERRALGAAHRRTVARLAAAVSSLSDVSSSFSTLATQWPPGSAAAAARGGPSRPRKNRPDRSLRRRHLRRGQKGGAAVGPTRRGKGSKIMAICDRHGLPVAVHVASASPYEPHLVAATLDARFLADLPTRLIGDRGYDSDALDRHLMTTYGIEMIAAHRRGRRQ